MTQNPLQTPEVVTLGCRLNAYESEVIRSHVTAAGLQNAIVVNTCAVTGEAERQARQTIRRLRRERPQAQIIVTGCAAQIHPETYAEMPEVTRVIGNAEKMDPASYRQVDPTQINVSDIMTLRETAHHLIDDFSGRARAFVQVQQGCDHRCTFCIIPYGRGPNRSLPIGAVVEQVRLLVDKGFHEVVLSGVDITSYGPDLPGQPSLGQLVRRLLAQVPDLPRLRLSSLDPAAVDDTLIGLFADEPRLMPHVHLSLQAGDDLVLKRMKRRHLRKDAIMLCDQLRERRAGITFGADLIAGFPTETDAMFQNSLSLVEDCGLTYTHVFPYSARKGTPAARMRQVPGPDRKARAARLRAAGAEALARYLVTRVGTETELLMEDGVNGHDPFFAPVRLSGTAAPGSLQRVRLTGTTLDHLIGVPLP
ncbi:MAG: tRNA (N(6)-L-threonylcarbamoyladenosine(37)-C(2))-methylthiotransferase MtaB [Magnetospiraceae bacterium]